MLDERRTTKQTSFTFVLVKGQLSKALLHYKSMS